MTITGKIKSRQLFGCYAVDFFSHDNNYLATLSLDTKDRSLDVYNIIYPGTTKENTLFLKGLIFKEFNIYTSKTTPNWTYKLRKWTDIFLSKRTLTTHLDTYEIFRSDEKLEVYLGDRKIGAVRKIYENIWGKAEYDIAFADPEDMELFIIIGSILIVLTEVVASRNETV